MKNTFHQPPVSIFILCVALILSSCSSIPLLASHTPAPECIGDTWSYDKNVQTEIEISPDLVIIISHTQSWFTTTPRTPDPYIYGSVGIYGNGSVIDSRGGDPVKKQISEDQLQQIIQVFEEANFFAITFGCEGSSLEVTDVGRTEISITMEGKTHKIEDHGNCDYGGIIGLCAIPEKVFAILGSP